MDKFTTIHTFKFLHRAYLVKGWLDSVNIDATIVSRGVSDILQSCEPNRYDLVVHEDNIDATKSIIDKIKDKYGEENQEPDGIKRGIKKILIPIDFSIASFNACKYGLSIANAKGAEVMLIHSYLTPLVNPNTIDTTYNLPLNSKEALDKIHRVAEEGMSMFIERVKLFVKENHLEHLNVKSKIIGGISEDSILSYAEDEQYKLIVIGTQNSNDNTSWYGDISSKIIFNAKVPVIAIPSESIFRDFNLKSVLYATRFDQTDIAALRKLQMIAHPIDINISVVDIENRADDPFANYDLKQFKGVATRLFPSTQLSFSKLDNKNTTVAIDNFVTENSIDIIAITTHKRNILTSLIKRSVTNDLVVNSKTPLLIFHAEH